MSRGGLKEYDGRVTSKMSADCWLLMVDWVVGRISHFKIFSLFQHNVEFRIFSSSDRYDIFYFCTYSV